MTPLPRLTHYLAVSTKEEIQVTHHESYEASCAHLLTVIAKRYPRRENHPTHPYHYAVDEWLGDNNITGLEFDYKVGRIERMS